MDFQCFAFIAASLDGFIAREDGDLSWLEDETLKITGEDYGYQDFFDSIDTIVVGRCTYEIASKFSEWPYANKRVVVLSHAPLSLLAGPSKRMESANLRPGELVSYLKTTGSQKVYVDGGKTIQSFLEAGFIDEITLTLIPILLGRGISLFTTLSKETKLDLVHQKTYKNGYVQVCYRLQRG
jgi:dihydrofolate reductase